MPYPKLFQPGRIGSLLLSNRIIMGAIGTRYDVPDGVLTDDHITYLLERAKGGTALVTTDGTSPTIEGRMRTGIMGIHDDIFIPRLRELADAIHANGAKLSVQFLHGGNRVSDSGNPDARPIAPSAMPNFVSGVMPREATKDDIAYLVEGYAQAALRCRTAGCDAVEVHGAHGYLGSQFLSPYTNHRVDEYGGTPEKRCRFLVEIVQRIKVLCGGDFPVLLKMNGDDQLAGGVTIADAVVQARVLAEAGYDALIISAGLRQSMDWQIQPYDKSIPAFIHLPVAIKQAVSIPVVAVGKIKTPAVAERVLAEGQADFVCIARPLIADPFWPLKAAQDRAHEIRLCVAENYGCIDRDAKAYPMMTCTINPAVGCEERFRTRPAQVVKRVSVIGDGLGAMRAASDLAARGHRVTLHAPAGVLGGRWLALAAQRAELRTIVNHLRQELRRHDVSIRLNSVVSPDALREAQLDAVVVSSILRPIRPDVPGNVSQNVVEAGDVLLGVAETGQRIAVLGAGVVALETALALASAGKRVSLISEHRTGADVGFSLRLALLRRLVAAAVNLFDHATLLRIAPDHVAIGKDGAVLPVPADTVVLALGYEQDRSLTESCEGIVPEVFTVDEAYDPRSALEAIRQAATVALEI